MSRETFYKQVVTRLYKQPYKDVKSLSKAIGDTEADFIREAIDRHIAYIKEQRAQGVQS